MKKYPVLFLVLAFFLFSGLAFSALADNGTGTAPFSIALTVSTTFTWNINRVTYTAKLFPAPDAPKLIYFYTAGVNQTFPNTPIAKVWTDINQVATYTFPQAPGPYQAMAVWADGPVKSNIVTYIVP